MDYPLYLVLDSPRDRTSCLGFPGRGPSAVHPQPVRDWKISRVEADPQPHTVSFALCLSHSPRLRAFCRLRLRRFGFERGLAGRVLGVHQQCLPLGIQNFQAIYSNIEYFRVSTN